MATRDHLDHLKRADISQIAPFVKTVAFVTPPNSWDLKYDDFKEMVLAQELEKNGNNDPMPPEGYPTHHWYYGQDTIDADYWMKKISLTEEGIRNRFDKYHEGALDAKDVMQGEELKLAWTHALRTLPDNVGLRFVTSKHDENKYLYLRIQPDWKRRPLQHVKHRLMLICEEAFGAVGDALFAAAIASIAEAGLKPRKLNIKCPMTGQFQWEALPDWERCDLSQVQSFKFQPQAAEDFDELFRVGAIGCLISKRASHAIAAVLKKCSESLKEFHCHDDCPIRWPGHKIISLPNLKRLSFGCGYIRPCNLKAWMAKMTSLEYLRFSKTHLWLDWRGTWLDIFDAIRNHPRGMRVEFKRIFTGTEEIS